MASSFAPSRSFGPSSSTKTFGPRQVQPSKPAPVDLAALQNATQVLQDQFNKDAQSIPDLGDTLTTRMSLLHSIVRSL